MTEDSPAARPLACQLAGVEVLLLPAGALWRPDVGLLAVSDLHFEKGASFARRGQLLPPHDTLATLSRLEAIVAACRPQVLVALGDSFHDRSAPFGLSGDVRERLRALAQACDLVWIAGNHDPEPPSGLGGRACAEFRSGPLVFRHEAETVAPGEGEISGHFHPCARVAGRGRSVRARCFVGDGRRLVMPAFGAYAGGLNVLDPAVAALFPDGFSVGVLGRDAVYATPLRLLLPEAREPARRMPRISRVPPAPR